MESIIEFLKELNTSKNVILKVSRIVKLLEKYGFAVDVDDVEKTDDGKDIVILKVSFTEGASPIMYIDTESMCLTDDVALTPDRFEKLRIVVSELKNLGVRLSSDSECREVIVRVPVE